MNGELLGPEPSHPKECALGGFLLEDMHEYYKELAAWHRRRADLAERELNNKDTVPRSQFAELRAQLLETKTRLSKALADASQCGATLMVVSDQRKILVEALEDLRHYVNKTGQSARKTSAEILSNALWRAK